MVIQKHSATAPQSNTAADSPGRAGVYCLHFNAAGVYQHTYCATAYTDDNTFTWTQVS